MPIDRLRPIDRTLVEIAAILSPAVRTALEQHTEDIDGLKAIANHTLADFLHWLAWINAEKALNFHRQDDVFGLNTPAGFLPFHAPIPHPSVPSKPA